MFHGVSQPKSKPKLAYFFPMKDQPLAVRDRLGDWGDRYKKSLKRQVIEDAIETAEWCYLAFAVFEEGATIETSYPKEALISATTFGVRPASRPPTTQPAAYAGYYLEQNGVDRGAVHSFIEGLVGRDLEPSELRKLLAPILKRLSETANAVSNIVLNGVTEATLKGETISVESMCAEMNQDDNRGLIQHLRQLAANRFTLLQRIKSGEFAHSPPVMIVSRLTVHGSAALSGEALRVGGAGIRFSVSPLASNAPLRGTFICSVPAWYPHWRGGL
jgi:hypothetical protein